MFVCSNQKLYNKKISLESITAESISYLSINGDWNYNQKFSHTYEMFLLKAAFLNLHLKTQATESVQIPIL